MARAAWARAIGRWRDARREYARRPNRRPRSSSILARFLAARLAAHWLHIEFVQSASYGEIRIDCLGSHVRWALADRDV